MFGSFLTDYGKAKRMSEPSVGVVITACADSVELRRCLLRICAEAAEMRAETVLVINATELTLAATARSELGDLVDRLLFEPVPGKSRALNHAVRSSDRSVLAFTDDDALPEDGWLHRVTAPLRNAAVAPGPSGVGGRVLPEYGERRPPRWYRELIDGYVLDDRDAALEKEIMELGLATRVTDSIMVDPDAAGRLAAVALELVEALR